jgi:signal transduction histidine kinase/HAMP domain-containing protein
MTRGRLALCGLLPVLILLAGQIASYRAASRPDSGSQARLEAYAKALDAHLAAILAAAEGVAERARDGNMEAAGAGLPAALVDRLEGAGVVRGGIFDSWTGTPAEAALFGEPGSVRILSRGIRTSLLARSRADAASRTGVASFTLEIHASTMLAQDLLPASSAGITARWDFGTSPRAEPQFTAGPPTTLSWPWRAGQARPLARLVLEEAPAAARAARARALAGAWAGLVFAMLAVFLLADRGDRIDARRLLTVVAGVIAARGALLAGRTLEELLPRSLGSPSLYGRGDMLGLCASPAALLATAIGVYLIATVVARFAAASVERGRRLTLLPLAGVALAGVAALVALASSLAKDARVRVPRLEPTSLGTLILALAAACVITGVAELLATLYVAARFKGQASARASRLAVAVTLLPLTVVFLAQVYRTTDRMVDERLHSEFAPLVLEQTARRRVALKAAIGEVAASPRVAAALSRAESDDDAFLAYDLWVESDLFHEGFASSLDLYDASGARRGHFGFAFPQVGGEREAATRLTEPGRVPVVELESVPAGASSLRVVHAEFPVASPSGRLLGRVVGHVLEDPSNLSFLPGSAPYVEALGGGPSPIDIPAAEAPDYVLFDEDGRVVLSTVRQPPAATPELRSAAAAGRALHVAAGDTRYHALPLADGGRLHLLMVPAPTILDVLGDSVRLLLSGLAVLAGSALVAILSGSGGFPAILDLVRGSFYSKLLAAVLVASVVPLVGLSIFLRAYIDRRGEASLADSAAGLVGAAKRVVEDYQTVGEEDPTIPRLRINDNALSWLRRVVGQEIHLYEDGVLAATSKPELFDSALLQKRLPGEVDREVVRGGQPFVVRREHLGTTPLPVAYARIEERGGPRDAVIAVPLVIEQRAFTRSVDRLVEMLLLLTTALVMLLAASAALITRSVSEPVRRLADASRRIAGGDYGTRLQSTSRDEMGSLVTDFNRMAGALAGQRADLIRRRDYIEALLRHATTGVLSADAAGKVVTINPAAEALLDGPDGPPRRGEPLLDALRRGATRRPLADALAQPPGSSDEPLEVDLAAGEGTLRLRVVRVPLPDPSGGTPGSLILLDDVTSLMRSNQLAAWAEMARAIAHEIKNPLTPIQLSTEHVRKLLHDRGILPFPEIDACLDTIVRKVRELRDISGAFSTYAKIPDLVLQRIDPARFLREVTAPYRTAPPRGVRIEERHDEAPAILADPIVLGRALVNLIENALQAMPGGGTLTIASRRGDPGEVVLEVEDTGTGLTPEARARLFEPYFSTKSSGTGLGLAIVRRVVLGHGGSIDVASAPGLGTTMRIRLKEAPRVESAP